MKRFIVLTLMLFILCGCSQTQRVKPVFDDVAFTANIKYNNDTYVCDVKASNSALNVVVSEPSDIKGFTLDIDKNGAKARFNGVDFEPNLSSLPQGAAAQILFDVIEDAKGKETVEQSDGNCYINGEVNNNKYVLTITPAGLPISLKIENINLEIEFQNVTLLN